MRIFALILILCSSLRAETIELAVGEWSPIVSEKAPGYGVLPQRLEKTFRAIGVEPVYRFFPWSRALKQVEGGQYLLSIGWIKNVDRAKRVLFSRRPVMKTETALFHLRNREISFSSFKDLVGLKIGITRDYAQGAEFAKAIEELGLRVEIASSDELNMRKLLSGRIDVFPIDRSVGHKLIEKFFEPHERNFIVDHPKAVASEPLWLIATKDNAKAFELLEKFNAAWK